MLRYTLRRLLWAIPTLFGVSLVVFMVTTLLPEPPKLERFERELVGTGNLAVLLRLEEERRMRFLNLPAYLNPSPSDARTVTTELVKTLSEDSWKRPIAAARLARLGGAALPHVVSLWPSLTVETRGRIAVALGPVARRMGLGSGVDFSSSDQALPFWNHFWEEWALDFNPTGATRTVKRLVHAGSDLREADVQVLDTLALKEVIAQMATTVDPVTFERLSRIASKASGRGAPLPATASDGERRRALADWQEWWFVHAGDFVVLSGPDRVAAMLGETRFGKWISRFVRGQLGVSALDGEPISQKLRERLGVTLLITMSAQFLSFAVAIPLGVITAWRRAATVDTVLAVVLFALYAMPTFWTAMILDRSLGHHGAYKLPLAILALTLASLAALSRQQRSAMLEVVRQDYVRTAKAKGVSESRLLIVHALRNAFIPTLTLASLQLPSLVGGAFMVEEIFSIQGLGAETIRAVATHDLPWLMAIMLLSAVVTTLALVLSDITHATLDPRVRQTLSSAAGIGP